MAHSKSVSALKLSQIHSYWGDTETIVSKQGMRMNNKGRMGFSLVAKAPDWTVTVYRNDDKKYMTQSLEQFIESGIVSDFIVSKQDRYVKKKAVAEPPAKLGDVEVLSVRLPNAGVTYLPLGNYAAPQVESILYVVFKVSTNGGIPIKSWKVAKGVDWMTGLKSRGDVKRFLYTTSVKKVQVPATTFDAPHGYTKAASVQEVLLSRAGRDASGDIDELFEIGKKQNVQK